jgi:isopenicillin N synthase-like dioxygenase
MGNADEVSIPTIDLSKADAVLTRNNLLQNLRYALLEVGFLYVHNHGIKPTVIDDLVKILPGLFALPDEVKAEVALLNSPHFLGFSKFRSETTASVQDEREQFELANELDDAYAVSQDGPLYLRLQGPNQWPLHTSIPDFRRIVETYVSAMQDLARRFLSLAAEALSVEQGVLDTFTGPQDRLKLVHYRPAEDATLDAQSQGVGPHKDSSGWMTFLLQASDPSIKGLQVLNKDGIWLDIPPVPGTLVVNMGQAFEVVTNGVCKATTHRVLLPPGDYDRYSVPFFQGVRPDLTKEDLKTLWKHFDPKKWHTRESVEGQLVDSPFLRGNYETWGEAQLRTKIRSHRDVGRKHYSEVFEKYIDDDR